MSVGTAIEWTQVPGTEAHASWNPIRARNRATGKVGWFCEKVSPGCKHCYASSMNVRLGTGHSYEATNAGEVELFLDEEVLLAPLKWRKPTGVFVCSMTDLFQAGVPDEWIDRIFAVMALGPQHVFQVLTKRAQRMREYVTAHGRTTNVYNAATKLAAGDFNRFPPHMARHRSSGTGWWPLPNVWLGVSAENQQYADERIPLLLGTPAAVRFVSAEPLLGEIDFTRLATEQIELDADTDLILQAVCGFPPAKDNPAFLNALTGYSYHPKTVREHPALPAKAPARISWVIIGGESGPGARPCNVEWVRSLVKQCKAAGCAVFVKQLGSKPLIAGHGQAHYDWGEEIGRSVRFSEAELHGLGGNWRIHLESAKGNDPVEWPEYLRIREYPEVQR